MIREAFAPQRGSTAIAIDTAMHALTTTAYIDTGSMASIDTMGMTATTLGMR